MNGFALGIHGGCGVMAEDGMSEAEWAQARDDLARSLRAGWAVLRRGGSALDAVEAAVVVMEDLPHLQRRPRRRAERRRRARTRRLDHGRRRPRGGRRGGGAPRPQPRLGRARGAGQRRARHADRARRGRFAGRTASSSSSPAISPPTQRRARSGAMQAHSAAGTVAAASEAEKHGTVGAVALDARGPPRGRDLDRRLYQQAGGPRRRQPDHRRRHLCAGRRLRRVGHRPGRVLHPPCPRPRDRQPHGLSRRDLADRRSRRHRRPRALWDRGRRDRHRRARRGRDARSTPTACSAAG